jgi:hypothetical protein
VPAPADLAAIRALSQYRPFEGGGESTRDAQDDLVLAVLAEAGGSVAKVAECRSHLDVLFRLRLEEVTVAAALARLIKSGSVNRLTTGGYELSAEELERLQAVAAESQDVAHEALDEWRTMLADRWPLTTAELDELEESLRKYLHTVLRRHGVEASLLLYPDSEEAQNLYAELEAEGFSFLPPIAPALREVRDFALSYFVRHPTDAQRKYLAQNLNAAYFLTVLSIDPDGARLITEIARGQRVYLDTNFVFRLLGIQGPRYIKPTETILRETRDAGYDCVVTPWTIAEFKESLRRSREFLMKYPIPPSEYAAIAAEATSDENFVTAYWRRVRSGHLSVADFMEKYDEIETLLSDRGILIESEGCTTVDKQQDAINDDMSVLENTIHGRARHPALIEHDVKHRLLVKRLRGNSVRNFSNAGYWFLTYDTVLPRYDRIAAAGSGDLAFCVSASAWFQIVDAFRPKTDDPGQSLADMLASPYVRYRRTLSQEAALGIVARVHEYSDGTPELAARIMMNSAAVHEIDNATSDEDRTEKIDSAILEAAKQAQEEARRDRKVAQQERVRADEIERSAQELLREAQTEYADDLGRTKLLGDEALRLEKERSERALREAEERHQRELKERERVAEAKDRELWKARRRLFRLIAFILAIVVFLALDLAFGLRTTWAVIVAVVTLLGLGIPLDAIANRRARAIDA